MKHSNEPSNKRQFNIRIEQSLLDRIRVKAKQDRRTVTASVEIAIELFCDGKLTEK